MKTNKLIISIIALLLSVCAALTFVACDTVIDEEESTAASSTDVETNKSDDSETEAESSEETETESAADTTSEDSSETSSDTEVTTEARFDYFAESMKNYASIDSSAYEKFEVKIGAEYEIDNSDVDEYIENLCFTYKTAANGSTKVTNKPTKKGDVAYIFYKGVMDGEEFEGGSNMDDESPYGLTIGSGTFIPGFEEGLIGVVPSETSPENMVAINLTFPENYGAADLAGKDATFYVYISWIVEYNIPEYNESFVRDTLKFESDSDDIVAAHRDYIYNYLYAQAQASIKSVKESHIWNSLVDSMEVTKYPEGEIASYYDYYYTEVEYYYTYYTYIGMKFESIDDFAVQFMGLEEGADWKAEITKYAEEATKQTMVYHLIAELEGIQITDDDVNDEINAYIDYYKNYYGKEYTKEEILQNIGEIAIKESALCTKVLDHLMERVTVIYE